MHRGQLTLTVGALLLVASLTAIAAGPDAGQQRRGAAPTTRGRATPAPLPLKTEAPQVTCPAPLGTGITSNRLYCDVMTGRVPAEGILIALPPHTGPVTLTFDLHNRHQYSEEQVQAKRAYVRYTATIGALTADNTLITRVAIQSEFRTVADLVDRIGGGAGPAGLKAVAPAGVEHITVIVPEEESQVSLLGEKITVERAEGSATYSSLGRPIAIVSNFMIEYRPAPPAARGRGRGL